MVSLFLYRPTMYSIARGVQGTPHGDASHLISWLVAKRGDRGKADERRHIRRDAGGQMRGYIAGGKKIRRHSIVIVIVEGCTYVLHRPAGLLFYNRHFTPTNMRRRFAETWK
jgi:hypothetical protein